jgi:hypothetical protein
MSGYYAAGDTALAMDRLHVKYEMGLETYM